MITITYQRVRQAKGEPRRCTWSKDDFEDEKSALSHPLSFEHKVGEKKES